MQLAVLIPVKRFRAAKGRLANTVPDNERARLAQWLATRVVSVASTHPTFIACDDRDVASWAEASGATVLWGEGLGLNGAVDDGIEQIAARGFEHLLITHADLAIPASLTAVARPGFITLVPDRRRAGTNVMSFPVDSRLRAAYGGASFGRHLSQATAIGTAGVEVRADPLLALDVDTGDDLAHPLINEVLPKWVKTNPDSRI